jgi:ADP-ribose pyrophosphatase YjhB (NUDIX family)
VSGWPGAAGAAGLVTLASPCARASGAAASSIPIVKPVKRFIVALPVRDPAPDFNRTVPVPDQAHPPAIAHCGGCGRAGVRFEEGKRFSCPACGWTFYQNPAAAVAALIDVGERVVFTRRNRDPGSGMLDLPGGFVDPGETAEVSLSRELAEELGLDLDVSPSDYLGSLPNTYLYKGVLYQTIDLFYRVRLKEVPGIAANDEIREVVALRPDEIDPGGFALPSVRAALARWVLGRARQPAPA